MRDTQAKSSSLEAERDKRRRARALRPAQKAQAASETTAQASGTNRRILLVDLNNCATFPTMSIGIIISALREHGHQVRLLCPLAYDVPATERERNETFKDEIARRARLSSSPTLLSLIHI